MLLPVSAHLDLGRLEALLDERLRPADDALERRFPGDRSGRQPVHTVYVPADRFDAGTTDRYGEVALQAVDEHSGLFQELVGGDPGLVDRVRAKLAREPVEDLRIDFEDGYGHRADSEEDDAARTAAADLRRAIDEGRAAPFHGIRFKCLERATRSRGIRTLSLFIETLTAGGPLPEGFVVTVAKVTSVDQVEAMVLVAEEIEAGLGLAARSLVFEIQVETPQSVLGPDGTALVARMIHAADGRCVGLHYGTYDYSASCGIAAAYQSMEHPAADHAKAVMQVAAAGTGVRLSDGSTNVLPVGEPHLVRAGWALHLRLVRRSLERGFYQGWDLHPAQLPTRYAATFAFYRGGLSSAAERLRAYERRTDSAILDEPATAWALASFVLRGQDCGAISPDEVAAIGLEPGRLATLARRGPDDQQRG
jgi:citrate lyase beta subunit